MQVSKTFDLGSNPSARASILVPELYIVEGFNKLWNMNKFSVFVSDSYKEMVEKVSWPTWEQLQQSTMIVLGATILITGIVWIMDFVANNSMKFIYSLFN